jgi:hypothetical protein
MIIFCCHQAGIDVELRFPYCNVVVFHWFFEGLSYDVISWCNREMFICTFKYKKSLDSISEPMHSLYALKLTTRLCTRSFRALTRLREPDEAYLIGILLREQDLVLGLSVE